MDVALEFFRAGRGVADWARGIGFDYEAFGNVVRRVGVPKALSTYCINVAKNREV